MEDIDYYEIPIYNFPYDVEEDDEETIQDNMELRVSFSLLPWRLIVTVKTSGLVTFFHCRLGGRDRNRWRARSC